VIELCLHDVEEVMRPRQAADVRRLDAVGILLDAHAQSSRTLALLSRLPFALIMHATAIIANAIVFSGKGSV
jgi:hypothetical protein